MAIGGPFREFGRFLDECEQGDRAIERVEITSCPLPDRSGDLTADVEVVLPPASSDADERSLALTSPRVGADGRRRFALEPAESLVPAGESDVDVEPTRARIASDGSISVSLRARAPGTDRDGTDHVRQSGGGTSTATPPADDGDDADRAHPARRDRDVPPFEDAALLRSIYESNDTFAAMAEAIEMDVTAETVRRYMIDNGVHEPSTYRTGGQPGGEGDADAAEAADGEVGPTSDGAAEPGAASGVDASAADAGRVTEPVVLSDGIGLPEDVTIETLIDTVKRSNTIYEVTREIDVDREDALEALQELNLLDLVVGRLATEGERDLTREEIVARLREASATG